jgi:protoporphyrinogen oxidase
VEQGGGRVVLGCPVVRLVHAGGRIETVVAGANGERLEQHCEAVISSMPLDELVASIEPAAPPPVEQAARALRHRALIVVGLVVRGEELFPDHWIYVHDPEVRVGRIQNYRNWSPEMCAGDGCSNLGLEYFCDVGDPTWRLSDGELAALATAELAALGLAKAEDVVDAVVFRQSKAYPVYDDGYRDRVAIIRTYLTGILNLQTIGRNGLHRYNNQDHSMVTALRAVDNLFGDQHDVWAINTERSHHEEVELAGR